MRKSPVYLLLIFAFGFSWLMPGSTVVQVASAFGHGDCGCLCPSCGEQCYLDISEGKEKKHYWEVETKQVCIPPVNFPWHGCKKSVDQLMCTPARTRLVRVLKKKEYECPKCKYEWKQLEVEEAECTQSSEESEEPSEAAESDEPPVEYEYESGEALPSTLPSNMAPIMDHNDGGIESYYVPENSFQSAPASTTPNTELPGIINAEEIPATPSTTYLNPQYRMPQRVLTRPSASSSVKPRKTARRLYTAGRSNRNATR